MRREDLQDIIRRIPTDYTTQIVFFLKAGGQITLDAMVRLEPEYFVMRGREGGTTDEGRSFYVPYVEVTHIKLDRVLKSSELKRMYGETVAPDREDLMASGGEEKPAAAPIATPPPARATDPASIAKQNLLDRIRAARTSGGANPPKPGG